MADHTQILSTQSTVEDTAEILRKLLSINQSINQSTVDDWRVSKHG